MNTVNLINNKNPYATIYYAQVKKIDDPTKQGRIKVSLPEVFGEAAIEDTPWIYPLGYNSGVKLFNVPDIDSEVGIVFVGDFYTGFYGIGRFTTSVHSVFKGADYPYLYGFEDAQGNYLTINKKTGDTLFMHKSGAKVHIKASGNVIIKATGTITLDAPQVNATGSMAAADAVTTMFMSADGRTITTSGGLVVGG